MPRLTRRTFSFLLFGGILICIGYAAAQQRPAQQSGRTQSVTPQATQATLQQQNDQLRDQLMQLQMQLKDVQAEIDELRSEQQVLEGATKETHDLLLDGRVVQTQGRQDLNSLAKSVGLNEKQIDRVEQQVSSMMLDLRRVKTKVGLY